MKTAPPVTPPLATDDALLQRLRAIRDARPQRLPDRIPPRLLQPPTAGKQQAAPAPPPLQPLRIQAGLEPYAGALTEAEAAHLLRRTGVAPTDTEVAALVGRPATEVVDELVDAALAMPLPDEPDWVSELPPPWYASEDDFIAFNDNNQLWYEELATDTVRCLRTDGLRERMTLFWHNHFVTGREKYYFSAFAYRYWTLLRTHALGNVQDFVRAMGLEPAMLIYLDGALNQEQAPNENYARELLELFTMGPLAPDGSANYTEADIQELARALTGYLVDWYQLEVVYFPSYFDDGEKTIFGQTDRYPYDGAIDLIFDQRASAIAHFLCRKLYTAFVYAEPDEAIVAELAAEMLAEGFEIAPVVRMLLKSTHFFDEAVSAAQIKTPLDLMLGLAHQMELDAGDEEYLGTFWIGFLLDQHLFDPPNVAGWPGHRTWVSTALLPQRWLTSEWIIWWGYDGDGDGAIPHPLVDLAFRIHDDKDPHAAFRLPIALAEYFLPVSVDQLHIPPVSNEFSGDLVNNPIPDDVLNASANEINLIKTFLGDLPWYEWSMGLSWGQYVLIFYVIYLTQLPEYQLT